MIKVSDYPNLNGALDACKASFGDKGGELALDKPTSLAAAYTYPHHALSVRGEGNASPITVPTAGDLLTFARSDGSEIRNILLRDFVMVPSVNRTSGWAVHIKNGVRYTVNNVDLGAPETAMHYGGLWIDRVDDSRVDDCNIYARHKGILAHHGADLVIGGGTKIQNHKASTMADALRGAVGIHIAGGLGGVYASEAHTIYCGIGWLLDISVAGTLNREIFLHPGTTVDSCVEDGIRLMAGSLGTFQATGVWAASNGRGGNGCGLRVQPNQHPIAVIQITGGRYFNNVGDGIALNGGFCALSGPVCDQNKGYGLHVANDQVRGAVDPLFALGNAQGAVRNVSPNFKVPVVY